MTMCIRPGCVQRGLRWPVICFGPPGEHNAYKLELPALVCRKDSETFNPFDYIGATARVSLEATLTEAGKPLPDWDVMQLEWREWNDPGLAELMASGEAKLWWADAENA